MALLLKCRLRTRLAAGHEGVVILNANAQRRLGVGGLLLLAALTSAPAASAQSVETVDVVVTAEVPARCGFTSAVTTREVTGDLENAGRETLRLSLDCNAPYAVKARALNGRMVRTGAGPDDSGYAFEKNYGVVLSLDTDKGVVVSQRCGSQELAEASSSCALSGSKGLQSGTGISIERDAALIIDWQDQRETGRRLAVGTYSDTIILEIGARA